MRLLHVNAAYAPFVGGAETYTQQISEYFAARGHAVTLATTDAAEVEAFWSPYKQRVKSRRETTNGVSIWRSPIYYLPLAPWSFYLLRRFTVEVAHRVPHIGGLISRFLSYFMPLTPGFARMLKRLPSRFDLVHGINIAVERPLLAAWHFARRCALPFVATPFVHTGEPGVFYGAWNYTMPHQLAVLRDAEAVIVQSHIERDYLARLGVPEHKQHIVGMGFDPSFVEGGDGQRLRQQLQLSPTAFVVLFVGVMTKDKGTPHLIEAVRHLWEQGYDAQLLLAGKPTDEFELYWRSLPDTVRQRIKRLGVIKGQLKQDTFAAADVLVLPSRTDSFGIVILEAWAYGKPVIGARAGGIPGVISHEHDGLLVNYGDVSALACAIARLIAHPDWRAQLGANGRIKAFAQFTWDRIAGRVFSIYQQVIEQHHAHRH